MACAFGVLSKNFAYSKITKIYCFRNFVSLALKFRSIFHFEWILLYVMKQGLRGSFIFLKIFFAYDHPMFLQHFLKRLSFTYWITFTSLWKINRHVYGLFLHSLLEVSSVYVCLSLSQYYSLLTAVALYCLEVRYCKSFTLFLFKIISAILDPLHFHVKFQDYEFFGYRKYVQSLVSPHSTY